MSSAPVLSGNIFSCMRARKDDLHPVVENYTFEDL